MTTSIHRANEDAWAGKATKTHKPDQNNGAVITANFDRRAVARRARCSAGSQRCVSWHEPMVLAVGLSLVMLGLGGFGGLINMSYAMNSMIHNTSWVTAHFHLIFGGAVVIMYLCRGLRNGRALPASHCSRGGWHAGNYGCGSSAC